MSNFSFSDLESVCPKSLSELMQAMFNLLGSYDRQFVRRVAVSRLNPKCVKKFAKFMVWGMISSEGVCPLVRIETANANVYFNLVEQHAISSLEASPNEPAISIQDNAPAILQNMLKIILNRKMSK